MKMKTFQLFLVVAYGCSYSKPPPKPCFWPGNWQIVNMEEAPCRWTKCLSLSGDDKKECLKDNFESKILIPHVTISLLKKYVLNH